LAAVWAKGCILLDRLTINQSAVREKVRLGAGLRGALCESSRFFSRFPDFCLADSPMSGRVVWNSETFFSQVGGLGAAHSLALLLQPLATDRDRL
jgi:hypothetical protein